MEILTAMGLSAHWWFWVLVVVAMAVLFAFAPRYPALVDRIRRGAVRRGLVSVPPGTGLVRRSRSVWRDPSWLALPTGVWVAASPWIWGYDDVSGAVPTDVATGGAVICVAIAAVVFPALLALEVLAGFWLVIAPWIVGYGDAGGPVGLSDTLAGLLLVIVALAGLAAAERQLGPGQGSGGIGRLR